MQHLHGMFFVLAVAFGACGYDDGTVDPGAGGAHDAPGVRRDAGAAGACSNSIDDDCDGLIDGADPGCMSAADTDERGAGAACDDGLDNDNDNDNDGQRDYVMTGCGSTVADSGCSSATDPSEVGI